MINSSSKTFLQKAALIAGITILISAIAAPFAEFFMYQKLVISGKKAETVQKISVNKTLFISGIFCYLVTFICDILVAWALYILLKPVNENLSLLTAWFRLVYAVISLAALPHLVIVFRLLNNSEYRAIFDSNQLNSQVKLSLTTFRTTWSFSFFIFSIHLVFLGYLVFKSKYIPRILGVILIINGAGYFLDTLKPFLFPDFNSGFIMITFFGELIFMLWLLIRGGKIQELTDQ